MQEPAVLAEQAEQKKQNTSGSFIRTYWKILLIFLVVFLFSIAGIIYLLKNNQPFEKISSDFSTRDIREIREDVSSNTWKIVIQFNLSSSTLSVKDLQLIQKRIISDFRSAEYSPYTLTLLNGQEKALFSTKVHINKFALYSISNDIGSESASITSLTTTETVIYIPYHTTGVKIRIQERQETVLEVDLPRESALHIQKEILPLERAYAEELSCRPLQVVFISDGYSNFDTFHQHVEKAKQAIESTEPFASVGPSLFDFKTIDNREPLGCSSGFLTCVFNTRVIDIGKEQYPNASKFLVLTTVREPGRLGVAQFLGDVGVISTAQSGFEHTAVHEFLGHAVSGLYDRYVMKGRSYDFMDPNVQSNCSVISSGSDFWKNVGVTNGYIGCMNQIYYAPSQPTCPSGRSDVISMGTPESIMSGGGCGSSQFDPVEKEWIKTHIIPLYTRCGGSTPKGRPTSTPVVSPTRGFVPVPTTPTFICEPDPNCAQKKNNLQLCQLICRPK